MEILPTTFDRSDKTTPGDRFNLFTAWFGAYDHSNTLFTGITAALHHRHQYFMEMRFKKQQFIKEIGLDWTVDAKRSFFSKVNSACDVGPKS